MAADTDVSSASMPSGSREVLLGPLTSRLMQDGKEIEPRQAYAIARELVKDTGGLIRILGDKYQERLMTVWLRAIGGKLKRDNRQVIHISGHLGEEIPDLPEEEEPVYFLVEDAPRIESLAEQLHKLKQRKVVVIATGLSSDWQTFGSALAGSTDFFISGYDAAFEQLAKEYLAESLVVTRVIYDKHASEDIKAAYRCAAFFDSCKVPVPVSLLAGVTRTPKSAFLSQNPARDALLILSASGEWVAGAGWFVSEAMLRRIAEDEDKSEETLYTEILTLVLGWLNHEQSPEGRQALRRLLHGLFLKHRRLLVREVLKGIWQTGVRPVILQEDKPSEMLLWAKLLGDLRLFEESQETFQSVIEKEPNNPYLLSAFGKMLGEWALDSTEEQQAERYQKVSSQFEAALRVPLTGVEQSVRDAYVFQTHGDLAAKLGRYEVAEKCFHYAGQRDPDNLHLLVSRAHALIRQAEVTDIKEETIANILQQALQLAPDNIYVHHVYGLWHMRRWQHREAQECFEAVMELDVENVAARHALGVLAMQRGHLTEAKELLNEAEKSDPENVQVLTSRGDLCIAVREFEAAESYFRRGLAFEERNLFIHVSLVKLYIAQGKDGGDFEQAEKALAATRTINGMSDYVLTMEGQLLLAKGELEPAHKVLNRLRQLRDKPPVATLNLLGQVLCRLGKPDAARQRFEQALYQEPRNQQTYCTWADTQMAAGDFGRASELLDKATQVDDGNAYVVQCLARLEQARGECYKADELYLKAKQLGLQS